MFRYLELVPKVRPHLSDTSYIVNIINNLFTEGIVWCHNFNVLLLSNIYVYESSGIHFVFSSGEGTEH